MEEKWKRVSEFPEYYEVSNLGNVRRIAYYSNQCANWESRDYILKPRKHTNGYLRVTLSVENKHYDRYIHRLVATEFCHNYNPKKYKEVNHIDGDKANNIANNLEWCDRSYNNKHAYVNGLHVLHGCYGRKKIVAQVDIKTNIIVKLHESVEDAARHVELKNFANISACCNYIEHPENYKRPCLSAKGYKWIFATENMKVGDVISFN